MRKKNVLFDFDGVIVDSFAPAYEVNQMICPAITEDDYRKRFEGNINDWHGAVDIHSDQCRHDIDFFTEYLPKLASVSVFPGMLEVVDELRKDFRLVVVSSTISSPIREYLEGHNIANHFDDILGNDVHTSKVEKINMVLQKHLANPKECIFITDTLGDIKEAQKAGLDAIAVSWGFHRRSTLEQAKPFRIVNTPAELLFAVQEYFKQNVS